jgi:transketolase
MGATFNKDGFPLVDNYTFGRLAEFSHLPNLTIVFLGDGCLQEGVASEACSLAGLVSIIPIY